MKKQTNVIPVYETTKVQTGTTTIEKFFADDGMEFKSERECIEYEERLKLIDESKDQFIELGLSQEEEEAILRLCFGAYGSIAYPRLIIWKAVSVNDENKTKIWQCLKARGLGAVYTQTFGYPDKKFSEGKLVLIASWTVDEHTDYPSYEANSCLLSNVIFKFSTLTDSLKQLKFNTENPE